MRKEKNTYCDSTCQMTATRYFVEPFCHTHVAHVATCAYCNRQFHTNRHGVKTCSNKCRVALSRFNRKADKMFARLVKEGAFDR